MTKLGTTLAFGLLLLAQTGCQTIAGRFNAPELPENGTSKTDKLGSELVSQQQLFINAAIAAQAAPTEHEKLMTYFETGVTLSDEICNDWFNMHFKADRETNHTKTLANIVGSTTVGVLGFTGAEAKQLGIFGLGMAGMNAEFENYMAYYLLSPAIPQLKKKINEGRASYADQMRTAFQASTTLTYTVVQRALISYHELCSRMEIQRLVTESVELAQYKVPDLKASANKARLATGQVALHELLTKGESGSLSADEVTALYVVDKARVSPPTDAAKQKLLKDSYTENSLYKPWIDRLTEIRGDTSEAGKTRNAKLSELLEELGGLSGGRQAWNNLAGGSQAASPETPAKPASNDVARAMSLKPQVSAPTN